MAYQVFDLSDLSSELAYGETQCRDEIKDGDILILANGALAILVEAWPTVFSGECDGFHELDVGWTFARLGAHYAANIDNFMSQPTCTPMQLPTGDDLPDWGSRA